MQSLLLQPVTAFLIFSGFGLGLYMLAGKIKSDGEPHHTHRKTYTGGEEIAPPKGQVKYHAFFWMALLFGILHMAALVLSTLPMGDMPTLLALLYLLGASAGVYVLSEEDF